MTCYLIGVSESSAKVIIHSGAHKAEYAHSTSNEWTFQNAMYKYEVLMKQHVMFVICMRLLCKCSRVFF